MKKHKVISVFEHQRLYIGQQGFKQSHLDALLKLNELHEGTYFEPIAKGIKFKQFVGVIQVDGISIQINPKADKDEDDHVWKNVLLQMLQACGKLKAQSTGAAHVKRKNLNLLEVYFELFLGEVDNLIRKGLIKQYRTRTKNTKSLKGKLEFAGHIKHNFIHKERFFTSHQVYDKDHLLHVILKKALDIVVHFTAGTRLHDLSKRIELNFPLVSQKTLTISQLNSVKVNRKSKDYSYALELARLIILNYSPDINSGREKMLSLLFDMNQLWEEFILKQLKERTKNTSIKVSGQESKSFWGYNTLRPDIVIRSGDHTYVLDTKWKKPTSNSASVSDLRQMYTYCRFWDAQKAILLYPGKKGNQSFKSYKTDDYMKANNEAISELKHQCKMSFINVLDEHGNLSQDIGQNILEKLNLEFI